MNLDTSIKKKKKKDGSNRKALILPVVIVLFLIGLVVWNNIQQETSLPNKDWSRSISMPAESISAEPIVYKQNDQYVVHAQQKEGIQTLHLDEKLNVVSNKTTKLPLDSRGNFWTNGKETAFISNGDLLLYKGKTKKVLDKNVELLADTTDRFAYSKGNEVYVYDPKSGNTHLILKAKEKVVELTGAPESSSFLAVVGEKVDMESFFLNGKKGKYDSQSILKYTKSATDTINNFHFAESQDKVHFIYTFYSSKQGTKSFKTFYGAAPQNSLKDLSFKRVSFRDSDLDYEIMNPKYQQLNIEDNMPSILFAARGPISSKKEAGNIYSATLKDDVWHAKRISTTNDFSVYPVKADDKTAFWLKALSVTDYQIYAASQDPGIIKNSESIHQEDVYNALFDAFAASIVSFIAMTNAFVWIVPPVLFLGILYFVRIDMIEEEKPWVKWMSIALFIITQLYVIQSLFNNTFYRLAPDYLTFTGSSFVIPVVVSIIALYTMQVAKNKEWGIFAQVSYFIGITVLFQLFVVGTYVY
jgi:hypothetical protein